MMAVHQVADGSLVEVVDIDVRHPRVPAALPGGGGPARDLERLESVRCRPFGNLLERERGEGRGHQAELHRCTSSNIVTGPPQTDTFCTESAPWMAAPIAPAHGPSSVRTTRTWSMLVTWMRFRSSWWVGARKRPPAPAAP